MKSILNTLRRNTGLSQSEAVAVAGIALLLLAGWVGRSLTSSPVTHDVESAQRVIEILDSLVAQTTHAEQREASSEHRGQSREQRAESTEQRAERTEQRAQSTEQRAQSTEQRATSYHRINVNTASSRQLEALPGIGPATARKIIEERSQSPFQSVEDLLRVRGIGPAKLERMRPYVTVP